MIGHHRRGRNNLAAEGVAERLHVRQIDEIGLYPGVVLAGRFIVGPNEIRADTADLIEYQVPAGERNGDNQDDRRVSDDQAQRREKCPQPVGMQRL
jgi:hypothetical protein